MNNKYPVRYPVGYNNRHLCVCSFSEKFDRPLDYIEARKKNYLPNTNISEEISYSCLKNISGGRKGNVYILSDAYNLKEHFKISEPANPLI